jgi:hypothetical protein
MLVSRKSAECEELRDGGAVGANPIQLESQPLCHTVIEARRLSSRLDWIIVIKPFVELSIAVSAQLQLHIPVSIVC